MAATVAEAEGVTAAMAGAEEMAVAAAQGGPEAAAEAEEMAATVVEAEEMAATIAEAEGVTAAMAGADGRWQQQQHRQSHTWSSILLRDCSRTYKSTVTSANWSACIRKSRVHDEALSSQRR